MIRLLKKLVWLLLIFIYIIAILQRHTVLAIDTITYVTTSSSTSTTNDINIDKVSTNSEACILIDVSSGKILYSKNADEQLYPASTTKLMTAILTLENCELTDVATVSHNAVYSIPSRLFSC